MSVEILAYDNGLVEKSLREAERIRFVLGDEVVIVHVGSLAVGIGGKNIVDILVGVKDFWRGLMRG